MRGTIMSKTLLVLAATSTGGLNFFRSIVTFYRGSRPEFALRRPLEFRTGPSEEISMSGENSCFSRFLVKFIEVSAAGLATAISAYALAHLGGSPVILSHASSRAGDRCSGRSARQRSPRGPARPTDPACCDR